MTTSARWLALLALLVLSACVPARREVEANMTRRVQFEGNGTSLSGHGDYVLRGQMEQESSGLFPLVWPFMYLASAAELQPDALPRDAYRLEVWYAHHGWFDARVVGWHGTRVRDRRGRAAGVWDLMGIVEPGEPTMFGSFEIEGLEGADALFARTIQRTGDVQVGDQFSLDSVRSAEDALLHKLYDHAYPYAKVSRSVRVYPEKRLADVAFEVTRGERAIYGDVSITGTEKVPSWLIEERVARSGLVAGEGYKQSDLDLTRRELFDLSTFAIVSIEPDLRDPTLREVPISVRLTESKFRTLRFGFGAEYDSFTFNPRVSTRFRHVNLFRRVIRLDVNGSIGPSYKTVPSVETDGENKSWFPPPLVDFTNPFLTYRVEAKVLFPRLGHPDFNLEAGGGIEQELQSGLFGYRRPSADLSVLWQPPKRGPKDKFRVIQIRVGPHIEQYRYLDLTNDTEVQARRLFGKGFQNPYQLLTFNEVFTWDSRDGTRTNSQFHTRGSFVSIGFKESVPVGNPGFFFGGVTGEVRRYGKVKLTRDGRVGYPLVWAWKGRTNVVQPFGDSVVPYPERVFLGGQDSIRGFRNSQVGPYEILCSGEDQFILPRGGNLSAETSGELRYDWAYGIKLATFVDAGILAEDWESLALDDFRWSAGTGLRYDTPIGPLRLDVSFRRLYPEDLAADAYTKCQDRTATVGRAGHEKEVLMARASDFFSNFSSWRGTRDRPPFAMVFFLAIGEAI
ncbi:MAG: outer membrane protein assembly factor BamA [Myxococcota bacterium]|jgi:outer membrane protein assembly factor BamA